MKTIGIIAGTKIDTAFGVEYFKKFGSTIGYPISDSPIEQTRLQALDRTQLTHKVQEGIDVLSGKKADKIIIY